MDNIIKLGPGRHVASLIDFQATLSGRVASVRLLLAFLKSRKFYSKSTGQLIFFIPSLAGSKPVYLNNASLSIEAMGGNSERICGLAVDILSSLYEAVREAELCNDHTASSLFRRLLGASIRPFLADLGNWLSGATLNSPAEFLIQR